MISQHQVIEHLRSLIEMAEEEEIRISGFGLKKRFDKTEPDFADFDSDEGTKIEDTRRRTLTIEFIE